MTTTHIKFRRALGAVLIAMFTQACGETPPTGPDPDDPNLEEVAAHLTMISDWPDQPAATEPMPDSTRIEQTVVDSVPTFDDDDQTPVSWDYDVDYICSTTPYSFQTTPSKIVMFSPDRDILWPGALLEGGSHRLGDGKPGSLRGMTIAERAPIEVTITGLPVADNSRDVEVVTLGNVESAIGSMIENAQAKDLFTPASDDFEVETFNSESEFALKTGLSGRYLRFRTSIGADVNRRQSETTVAVRYVQKMYTIVVPPPPTPARFFSADFTQAVLANQQLQGRMTPDNPPVYVANVVYGRMMMFTLTAQASSDELKAIVNASYDAVVGGVQASLSSRQEEIMSTSRIQISTHGGGLNGTADMIRTGDWKQYFTPENDVQLSEALPLSYTFRTLTGETAAVSEATEYEVETCQALASTPLLYPNDGDPQSIGLPVPTPFTSHLGDVTGDDIDDLILNHRAPSSNQVAVLPGTGSGSFGAAIVSSAPTGPSAPPDGWGAYQLLIGNVDGDAGGQADLVWNNTGDQAAATNRVFVALGQADGTLQFLDPQVRDTPNWPAGVRPVLADLDGDGADDLVFNYLSSSQNRVDRSMSNGDGTFEMNFPVSVRAGGGWNKYDMYVGNADFDATKELFWNSRRDADPNRTYSGRLDGASVAFSGGYDHPTPCCWTGYERIPGDFDGDQRTDLVFLNGGRVSHSIYGLGFGTWNRGAQINFNIPSSAQWAPQAGDFNGDGVDDLVLHRVAGGLNKVYVVHGKPSRGFKDAQIQPDHPVNASWEVALGMLVGDVTGEGRSDVVWVIPGADTQVYVGLGRQD